MKQIILITDGCSNVGISPVIAAAHAKAEGIVVHVVGIADTGRSATSAPSRFMRLPRPAGDQPLGETGPIVPNRSDDDA